MPFVRILFSVGLALVGIFVSGCGRQGEVVALIKKRYPNMAACGTPRFTSFTVEKESHWHLRTYRIEGSVYWASPFFLVERILPPYRKLPEIVFVKPYDISGKNGKWTDGAQQRVRFTAIIYKGAKDYTDSVNVKFPYGIKFISEKGLKAKYRDSLVVSTDGRIIHGKIPEKDWKRACTEAVNEVKRFQKRTEELRNDFSNKVEVIACETWKRLKEPGLQDHLHCVSSVLGCVTEMAVECRTQISNLIYFTTFPVTSIRNAEVLKQMEGLKKFEDTLEDWRRLLGTRTEEINTEMAYRQKNGVTFMQNISPRTTAAEQEKTHVITYRHSPSRSSESRKTDSEAAGNPTKPMTIRIPMRAQ